MGCTFDPSGVLVAGVEKNVEKLKNVQKKFFWQCNVMPGKAIWRL